MYAIKHSYPPPLLRRTRYYGEHANGMRHGFGIMKLSDGSGYMGQWGFGKPCGQGRLVARTGSSAAHGESYEGDFREGDRHGEGVLGKGGASVWKDDLLIRQAPPRWASERSGEAYPRLLPRYTLGVAITPLKVR